MELNREQIIKAVECQIGTGENHDCRGCYFHREGGLCIENMSEGIATAVLALIRELTAENGRLAHASECHRQTVIDNLHRSLEYLHEEAERVKADTVREFADKIKGTRFWFRQEYVEYFDKPSIVKLCPFIDKNDIEQIAQEMLEEGR